jgi:hypothetical protein
MQPKHRADAMLGEAGAVMRSRVEMPHPTLPGGRYRRGSDRLIDVVEQIAKRRTAHAELVHGLALLRGTSLSPRRRGVS